MRCSTNLIAKVLLAYEAVSLNVHTERLSMGKGEEFMDFSNLYFVGLFCPNCGRKIIGYKSNDGALRVSCPKCDVKLFSKQRNRREINIKMTETTN